MVAPPAKRLEIACRMNMARIAADRAFTIRAKTHFDNGPCAGTCNVTNRSISLSR
jgi:hypothetical protein